MLILKPSTQFKKDLKKFVHQKKTRSAIDDIIFMLQKEEPLPAKNNDHLLAGNWKGYRECHVTPDLLLIYRVEDTLELLHLARVGSHSELF